VQANPREPESSAGGNPPVLFGRDPLLRTVTKHLREGWKVLLTGPAGTGKSAVIQSLLCSGLAQSLDRSLIVCNATSDSRAIIEAAARTFRVDHAGNASDPEHRNLVSLSPRRKTVLQDRRSAFYKRVQNGRWLLVLDHLSSRDPGIRRLLEFLFDFDVLVLGATRSPRAADMGHAWKTVWRWQVLKVPPLGGSASRALIARLTDDWATKADHDAFRQRLMQLASGNPGIMVEICRRGRKRMDQSGERVDALRLWLDWLADNRSATPE
jgi:hypothetical protein